MPLDNAFTIHRSNVNAWECDENGHLNVRFYIAKNYQALIHLLAELGLTQAALKKLNGRPRLLSQHVRYHREALVALPFVAYGRLTDISKSRIHLYTELRSSIDDTVYTTFNSEIVIEDTTGQALDTRDIVNSNHYVAPKLGAVRSLPPSEPPKFDIHSALAAGYAETARGVVNASDCDGDGRLEAFQYAGRIADAIPNFLSTIQSPAEFALRASGELGGAVIESRADYLHELRVDHRFVVLSGLREFSDKIMRLSHLIFDLDDDALAFHSQGIAVALDLKARRAVGFSDERKVLMTRRLIRAQ